MKYIINLSKAVLIFVMLYSFCFFVGCPRDRLSDGISVIIDTTGVYFVFDRKDISSIWLYKYNDGNYDTVFLQNNIKNISDNLHMIQDQSDRHNIGFQYGMKYTYIIETSGKSWHGYIQFDHKDPSMAGKTVDFEDTSKMMVTFIIDDSGKEAKRMEVKGSAYDK